MELQVASETKKMAPLKSNLANVTIKVGTKIMLQGKILNSLNFLLGTSKEVILGVVKPEVKLTFDNKNTNA